LIRLLSIISVLIFSGCAIVPAAIEGDNFSNLNPAQVAANAQAHQGSSVRWGGIITEIINNEQETWIEILALPLGDTGKPSRYRQNNYGRFLAKTKQFLDPEVYENGMRITVVGQIDGVTEGKVGKRDYSYPTVIMNNHYLWPNRSYNTNHYIHPGYWYYGFHPFWRFGYQYYGYGIWNYPSYYYPYFPVYGYMSRSQEPIAFRTPGDFRYSRQLRWPNTMNYYQSRRMTSRVRTSLGDSYVTGNLNNRSSNKANTNRYNKPAKQRNNKHRAAPNKPSPSSKPRNTRREK